MNSWSQKLCKPSRDLEVLDQDSLKEALAEISGWSLAKDTKKISKSFKTKSFLEAVEFINKIAVISEENNHHPDLHLVDYKMLTVELCTHESDGITENDVIMAAKINQITYG